MIRALKAEEGSNSVDSPREYVMKRRQKILQGIPVFFFFSFTLLYHDYIAFPYCGTVSNPNLEQNTNEPQIV